MKIAIVVSEFNFDVTRMMLEMAREHARFLGVEVARVHIVPGVFELPMAAKHALSQPDIDGVAALGAVIEGETRHDEVVIQHAARKIMDLDAVPISATCVRVPVERAHSEAVQVTTEKPLGADQIRQALADMPGVQVLDDVRQDVYPTPLEMSGKDDVYSGSSPAFAVGAAATPRHISSVAKARWGLLRFEAIVNMALLLSFWVQRLFPVV